MDADRNAQREDDVKIGEWPMKTEDCSDASMSQGTCDKSTETQTRQGRAPFHGPGDTSTLDFQPPET